MRLAFFVNDVATDVDEYTTTRLARAAAQGGHEVWYVGVGDVELGESDGRLVARAHAAEFDKDPFAEYHVVGICTPGGPPDANAFVTVNDRTVPIVGGDQMVIDAVSRTGARLYSC